MKHYIILFILLIANLTYGQSENYTVIKVQGSILQKKSGDALTQGSVFASDEQLLFETSDSRAAVIGSTRGRFILKSGNSATASSNLLPAMSNMSSRAGALINFIDLQNHFKGNYLVLNKTAIRINTDNFPMDIKNLFYIRYEYKNEAINKKLTYKADTLYIDKKELFMVDGKPIPTTATKEVKLFYMETGNKSTLINEFTLVTPDNQELKREIQIILDTMKDKSYEDQVGEIVSYLNEYYGKPDKNNIKKWLRWNFGLK